MSDNNKTSYFTLIIIALFASRLAAQWNPSNEGIGTNTPHVLMKNDSRFFACGFEGVFISDDGKNWQLKKTETNGAAGFYSMTKTDDGMMVAGLGGCFKSTDNGLTWKKFMFDQKFYSFSSINAKEKDLYAESIDGLFLADNNGRNTRSISGSIKDLTYLDEDGELQKVSSVYAVLLRNDAIYIGTGNGVYVSTNKGDKWQSLSKGLPKGKSVTRIFAMGPLLFAAFENAGSYVSANNGESWTKLEGGLPKKPYIIAMATSGNILFASVFRNGVFYSTDNGATWIEMNEGLGKKERGFSLLADGNNLYAGLVDKGIYVYDISKLAK